MKAPAVSSVTKSLENRILNAILGTLPEPALNGEIPADSDTVQVSTDAVNDSGDTVTAAAEPQGAPGTSGPALPQTRLGRKLVKKLGAETAVEALIMKAFGEKLDPSRYGPITELNEVPQRELEQRTGKGKPRTRGPLAKGPLTRGPAMYPGPAPRGKHGTARRSGGDDGPFHAGSSPAEALPGARVYVGLGRRHGASARDVAALLGRAGGVPGRLVESIEVKDYCAFATLPSDAARRACAFSRNTPDDPAIKPASPGGLSEPAGKAGPAHRGRR
jgi:ATP-dependent RNA helicase DeaD